MSDLRVLTGIIGDIVTNTLEANPSLDVNANYYTDHKGRAAGAIWLNTRERDFTPSDAPRYVEVILNTAGRSEHDATITVNDREKNLAESGNPNLAEYSPDMYVDASGAAQFLVRNA